MGKLVLLPNLLDKEGSHSLVFPPALDDAVRSINGLIAESEKEARAYLKRFGVPFREFPIFLLNEHTQDLDQPLTLMQQGQTFGLISDAGLPILADPGATLVSRARNLGIDVQAFVGPSSIVLALMLSGLPSQRFAFHGYFPYEPEKALKKLELRSKEEKATQIFIEAPYRNEKIMKTLLENLQDQTVLSVACDLTMATQQVMTYSIKEWKKQLFPSINKRPAVFLFHA